MEKPEVSLRLFLCLIVRIVGLVGLDVHAIRRGPAHVEVQGDAQVPEVSIIIQLQEMSRRNGKYL